MLGFMRKHAQGTFIKIVFWMIIIVFVFWGVGVMVSGGNRVSVAATVDGQPIGVQEYQRAYENMHRIYQQLYKDNLSQQVLAQLNLEQRALDDLINDMLLRREAARLGLQVSDDEVRDSILNIPSFRDGARFDRSRYLAALRSSRLTPAEFEESQRESLLINKLESLLTDGLYVSDRELHDLFVLENEKINVAFASIPYERFKAASQVSDDEVKEHYEKYKGRFQTPEKATITYVDYDPAKLAAAIPVSDDNIKAYYDSHDSDYQAPAKVHLRQILFVVPPNIDDAAKAAIHTKAENVLTEARTGGDFATLAKEHSGDPLSKDAGGDLGWVEKGKLETPVEEAAFAAEAGTIPDLVESSRGLHVLKIEEVQPEKTRPLAEVRDDIVKTLQERNADETTRKALEEDLEKARGGAKIEELAAARGLQPTTSPQIARGQPVPGVVGMQLPNSAFAQDAGAVDEIQGVEPPYYLFKVVEKTPSATIPLEEARAGIVESLNADKAKKAARTEAEALLAKGREIGGVAGLEQAAREKGYKVEDTDAFGRSEKIPKLAGAPISEELFALTSDAPFAAKVHPLPDNVVVLALRERTLPDESTFAEKRDGLRDGAIARKRVQVLENYRNALRQRADISVNPDIVTNARS